MEKASDNPPRKMVSKLCMSFHPFHRQLHYAARPNWSRSSFPTPSSVIWLLTTARTQLDINQKIKKWLIEYLAVVRLKEVNADKEAAGTTVAREETVQQAETAALSMEVNPQAPLSVMCPSLWWFLRYLLLFPNLAHHRPRVYLLGHQVQAKFVCQSIPCAVGHPFQRISSGGVLMKPNHALTEVFTLYLVPDSFKHFVKCQPHVLTLSFFSAKMTKWQSDIHWNPFAAVLKVLDLWGKAFGWGMEGDRWKKTRREVVLIVMVMMMNGMVVRVNVNVNRMRLREVKWAESRLQMIKRTGRNLRTYSLLASACLVKFQMVYMLNHCFLI